VDEKTAAAREAKYDELQRLHGKIGLVEFNGHSIVFGRPSRDQAREWRRMRESKEEKHNAMESLAQMSILAFDDIFDANAARTLFTGSFLVAYPLAVSSARFQNVLSALGGILDDEEAADLGKGARIKGLAPPTSPPG
jgi:hypothetical protein